MGDFLPFVTAVARGLIRDQRTRRALMFYTVLGALGLLFIGAVVADGWLGERPFWFLVYWAACAWLTVLALLLALFDMLIIRAEGRRRRRELAAQCFAGEKEADEDAR